MLEFRGQAVAVTRSPTLNRPSPSEAPQRPARSGPRQPGRALRLLQAHGDGGGLLFSFSRSLKPVCLRREKHGAKRRRRTAVKGYDERRYEHGNS